MNEMTGVSLTLMEKGSIPGELRDAVLFIKDNKEIARSTHYEPHNEASFNELHGTAIEFHKLDRPNNGNGSFLQGLFNRLFLRKIKPILFMRELTFIEGEELVTKRIYQFLLPGPKFSGIVKIAQDLALLTPQPIVINREALPPKKEKASPTTTEVTPS